MLTPNSKRRFTCKQPIHDLRGQVFLVGFATRLSLNGRTNVAVTLRRICKPLKLPAGQQNHGLSRDFDVLYRHRSFSRYADPRGALARTQRIEPSVRTPPRQSCTRNLLSSRPCDRVTLALNAEGSAANSAIFDLISCLLFDRNSARTADLEKRTST